MRKVGRVCCARRVSIINSNLSKLLNYVCYLIECVVARHGETNQFAVQWNTFISPVWLHCVLIFQWIRLFVVCAPCDSTFPAPVHLCSCWRDIAEMDISLASLWVGLTWVDLRMTFSLSRGWELGWVRFLPRYDATGNW